MKNKFGIILTPVGPFGGAQRRFTNLFNSLYVKYPENIYYFVSHDLYNKIFNMYPGYNMVNVIPIGKKELIKNKSIVNNDSGQINKFNLKKAEPDILRKISRYLKSFLSNYFVFNEIKKYQKKFNINVFMGVYSGIIPLYFYLRSKKKETGIIFCDMDSWFSEVLPKEKKYWYRKYSSFNYALENSDYVDFLSPFILEGVKERGIKIKDESVSITPCSFTDYSKCTIGNKSIFKVAFAGRLEKNKNPDIFLEAAFNLSKKYPEIIFHIMGEGRLSANVQSQITNSGLNNIVFHGFHPQPTDILADTSVFVSIQTTNNYPSQSVLEAMGCGNAIVATNVGDTAMFINESNGILINLDAKELSDAIETLYLNKGLRDKLGNYAYSYVRENHTVEKMADYYISLFNKTSSKYIKKKN